MTLCSTKQTLPYWNDPEFKPVIDTSLMMWLASNSDITTTIWADVSGKNSYATMTGSVTREPIDSNGIFGTGFKMYDGTYGTINMSVAGIVTRTFEGWIKPVLNTIHDQFIFGTEGTRITIARGTNLIYHLVDGYVTTPIQLNVWSHVAFITDGTRFYTYVNGVSSSATGTLPSIPYWNFMILGSYFSSPTEVGYHFNGSMTDVKMYTKALTPTEVTYNYTHSPLYYLNKGIV